MPARCPSGPAAVRGTLPVLLAFLAGACATVPQVTAASEPAAKQVESGRIDLLLGYRWHDDALPGTPAFEDLDEAVALGVHFAYEPPSWPVGLEMGVLGGYSEDDALAELPEIGPVDLDLELSTSELYFGLGRSFRLGERWRPYVGAGLSLVMVEGELSSTVLGGSDTEDDLSAAGYVHGGVLVELGRSFHVGLDGRAVLGTDLELDGLEIDADYLQLALVAGWRF
jgi:hypothetical protein